jgi:multidrug resistance efflux pump
MIQRVITGIIVVAVLILLILYSQLRTTQPFVSGIVEADEIRLGSRVGGRVSRVFVDEGDRVETGAPLIEFEPYDLIQREQQAFAQLAESEANLRKLETGFRPEEITQAGARVDQLSAHLSLLENGPRQEEIDAARERLNASIAELRLARQEYDRVSNLAQSNAVSAGEIDIAKEKFDGANANVEVKKNELAILEAGTRAEEIAQARAQVIEAKAAWELAQHGYRSEDIEQARASCNAAAAALEVIRQQKTELVIVAPTAGYIDAFDLQPGDLVGANAPVMTLLSEQRLWIRAYVPQRFLRLSVGQQLRVTIDSIPDRDFQGEVSFISHQAEFTPNNVQTSDDRARQVYRIRVALHEGADQLRVGMTANVWLNATANGSAQ